MKKKNTIKDIAILAGVSIGTVDRVIHNRGKVSQQAHEKVKIAIEQLDYRPNLIARNLKNNTFYSIHILVPNPNLDHFWKYSIEGINEVINEYIEFNVEAEITYFNPTSASSFLSQGLQILSKPINALLFVPLFVKESKILISNLKLKDILIGTFNSYLLDEKVNFVGQDLFLSGRVAAKLFQQSKAFSNIAIIHVGESTYNAAHMLQKEKGFLDFYEEVDGANIVSLTLKNSGFENQFITFIKANPNIDSFFITNSKAYLIVKLLNKLNKKNITLIGYDLLDENVDYLKKGDIQFLIHQNPKNQASLALRYQIERLLFNRENGSEKFLPIDIINLENVDSYLI